MFPRFQSLIAGLAMLLLAPLALAADPCPQACPAQGPCCEEVCKKDCVPTIEQVKKTTPVYSMKCEDLCLPKCSFGGLFSRLRKSCGNECGACSDCNDCGDCARCGKPREVRKLVKKFKTEEECKVKCVVEHRMELVPVKQKKVECVVECAPAPCAPATCAPACERAPRNKEFCCPDYSNPYAGTPLDPNPPKAAPKAEPIPAPAKEAGKVGAEELPIGLPQ
ncbi:MAG: hypothetical protein JNM56_38570 [Planctomycetia bacterium]|nr:hypothetical protein [Planctomycetia bacterium]